MMEHNKTNISATLSRDEQQHYSNCINTAITMLQSIDIEYHDFAIADILLTVRDGVEGIRKELANRFIYRETLRENLDAQRLYDEVRNLDSLYMEKFTLSGRDVVIEGRIEHIYPENLTGQIDYYGVHDDDDTPF